MTTPLQNTYCRWGLGAVVSTSFAAYMVSLLVARDAFRSHIYWGVGLEAAKLIALAVLLVRAIADTPQPLDPIRSRLWKQYYRATATSLGIDSLCLVILFRSAI